MKNIVINEDYNAVDLKPSVLLREYLALTERDVRARFAGHGKACSCPACGTQGGDAFERFSLKYQSCPRCGSLFVSPRPADTELNDYYLKSPARAYWRDVLLKATDQKRKEKIVKPRFQWILESTREHLSGAKVWMDLNTTQYSYVDAMADADIFSRKILLNPYLTIDAGRYPRVEVLHRPWWDSPSQGEVDILTLFEVVDHTSDIDQLFKTVKGMLKPGGLCFLTTILASGFDVSVLWDRADHIHPPDRLNCLTTRGYQELFNKHGFECLEFSTPGILDLEFVAQAYQRDSSIPLPRFVRDLILSGDDLAKHTFQQFLQSACLSSYGRILVRKKG